MKKVFMIVMALVMVFSLSISAFAAGAFVDSPSNNEAPVLDGFEVESPECPAEIVVTPYSERDTLSDEGETEIEEAYATIVATDDVTTLCEALAELTAELGIASSDLAISDLFDVSCINCDEQTHEAGQHGAFTIKLSAETLKNFVGLLHYKDGSWELVEEASVDGDVLTFVVDSFSPFAVVVNTGVAAGGASPATGDTGALGLWTVIACISGAGLLVCLTTMRKKKA